MAVDVLSSIARDWTAWHEPEVNMAANPNNREVSSTPTIVPSPPVRKSRLHAWPSWIIAAVVAVVALGAILHIRHRNAITYETVPVERGSIQAKVTATGNLNPVVDVLVSSQVSGNIKALYADWNSRVKKGQLVALIDPQIFQAQVDQAKAVFQSMHSATLTAQAQVAKIQSDVSAAIANQRDAEAIAAKGSANQKNVELQWRRAQNLWADRVISQQDYDTAKANYDAATAQLKADQALIDAARQNTISAQASVRVASSQLAAAQAQEHQAQAGLNQAQINLDHTRIFSPVDGTVVARRMDVGQTVAATLNPPIIFEIAQDLTKMQVDANVDESDVGNVATGQRATFTVDSYAGATFQGVVTGIRKAPIITQNVVTYDVVIAVDNSDLRLFPGMTANVTILSAKVDDTLKVPNAVLRFRPSATMLKRTGLSAPQSDKPQIYVLSGRKPKAVPVAYGLSDGKYTAIASDALQPGMQVIVRATSASSGSSATTTPMAPRR